MNSAAVTLTCKLKDIVDNPTTVWWSGGESGSEDNGSVLNGEQTTTLTISTITSYEETYTCQFSASSYTFTSTITVYGIGKFYKSFCDDNKRDENYKRYNLTELVPDPAYFLGVAGEAVTLRCRWVSSGAEPTFTWTEDGVSVHTRSGYTFDAGTMNAINVQTSTLVINPAPTNDMTFTCQAVDSRNNYQFQVLVPYDAVGKKVNFKKY